MNNQVVKYSTLKQWLAHLETERIIDRNMDLARVSQVKEAMGLFVDIPVITVAGTNGKGSTCAFLEAILVQAGYQVGCYTSPHLLEFNERARINSNLATDEVLLAHFERVEKARQSFEIPIHLSYFEFTFLAILSLFLSSKLDVLILEVGVGGRLDAVNCVDADCAIVTSVDLDHTELLGNTRELIAREKAGIFRVGCAAIVGDPVSPQALIDVANEVGADLWLAGRDFFYQGIQNQHLKQWSYLGRQQKRLALAYPSLRGANQLLNASASLAALEALYDRLPVTIQDIRIGLSRVSLQGRFQILPGRPTIVLDVAHNPHAAAVLADNISNMGYFPTTYAVLGVMQDKAIAEMVNHLKTEINEWYIADLGTERAASATEIMDILIQQGISKEHIHLNASVDQALKSLLSKIDDDDRIIVFGSFFTVSDALSYLKSKHH